MKKITLFSLLLALGLFVGGSEAHAASGSITINMVDLMLFNDADGNGFVDEGDTIQVRAVVTNTDGSAASAGTIAVVDIPQYQGLDEVLIPLDVNNNGSMDIYRGVYTVAGDSTYTWGIEVAAGDSASAVEVKVFDNDDNGLDEVTATTNAIGDGSVDTTANGVDTLVPNTQNTTFTSDITAKPSENISVNSAGSSTYTIWFSPFGTLDFSSTGPAQTNAGGNDLVITAPESQRDDYRLYVIDVAGNISDPSTAVLTVVATSGGGGAAMSARSISRDADNNADSIEDNEDSSDDEESESEDSDMPDVDKKQQLVNLLLDILRNPDYSYDQKKNAVGLIIMSMSMQGL